MKLIRLDGYNIVFEDELMLLIPFRKLYKQDKTRGKDNFLNFLTIVYYTYDPRSDYSYILDDDTRLHEVCESNGIAVPKFSKLELECIELYKKLTTTISQGLLKSTKIAIDKLSKFLETFDVNERTEKNTLVMNISSFTQAINKIPELVKNIREAEVAVAKEIEEQGRARGGNESKALMEDGIMLS